MDTQILMRSQLQYELEYGLEFGVDREFCVHSSEELRKVLMKERIGSLYL